MRDGEGRERGEKEEGGEGGEREGERESGRKRLGERERDWCNV